MSTTKTIKLIDGSYEASDAAEILYAVINDKIKFHNVQINSCLERNEGNLEHSKERLKALHEEKKKIVEILSLAEASDSHINLSAEVNIEIA